MAFAPRRPDAKRRDDGLRWSNAVVPKHTTSSAPSNNNGRGGGGSRSRSVSPSVAVSVSPSVISTLSKSRSRSTSPRVNAAAFSAQEVQNVDEGVTFSQPSANGKKKARESVVSATTMSSVLRQVTSPSVVVTTNNPSRSPSHQSGEGGGGGKKETRGGPIIDLPIPITARARRVSVSAERFAGASPSSWVNDEEGMPTAGERETDEVNKREEQPMIDASGGEGYAAQYQRARSSAASQNGRSSSRSSSKQQQRENEVIVEIDNENEATEGGDNRAKRRSLSSRNEGDVIRRHQRAHSSPSPQSSSSLSPHYSSKAYYDPDDKMFFYKLSRMNNNNDVTTNNDKINNSIATATTYGHQRKRSVSSASHSSSPHGSSSAVPPLERASSSSLSPQQIGVALSRFPNQQKIFSSSSSVGTNAPLHHVDQHHGVHSSPPHRSDPRERERGISAESEDAGYSSSKRGDRVDKYRRNGKNSYEGGGVPDGTYMVYTRSASVPNAYHHGKGGDDSAGDINDHYYRHIEEDDRNNDGAHLRHRHELYHRHVQANTLFHGRATSSSSSPYRHSSYSGNVWESSQPSPHKSKSPSTSSPVRGAPSPPRVSSSEVVQYLTNLFLSPRGTEQGGGKLGLGGAMRYSDLEDVLEACGLASGYSSTPSSTLKSLNTSSGRDDLWLDLQEAQQRIVNSVDPFYAADTDAHRPDDHIGPDDHGMSREKQDQPHLYDTYYRSNSAPYANENEKVGDAYRPGHRQQQQLQQVDPLRAYITNVKAFVEVLSRRGAVVATQRRIELAAQKAAEARLCSPYLQGYASGVHHRQNKTVSSISSTGGGGSTLLVASSSYESQSASDSPSSVSRGRVRGRGASDKRRAYGDQNSLSPTLTMSEVEALASTKVKGYVVSSSKGSEEKDHTTKSDTNTDKNNPSSRRSNSQNARPPPLLSLDTTPFSPIDVIHTNAPSPNGGGGGTGSVVIRGRSAPVDADGTSTALQPAESPQNTVSNDAKRPNGNNVRGSRRDSAPLGLPPKSPSSTRGDGGVGSRNGGSSASAYPSTEGPPPPQTENGKGGEQTIDLTVKRIYRRISLPLASGSAGEEEEDNHNHRYEEKGVEDYHHHHWNARDGDEERGEEEEDNTLSSLSQTSTPSRRGGGGGDSFYSSTYTPTREGDEEAEGRDERGDRYRYSEQEQEQEGGEGVMYSRRGHGGRPHENNRAEEEGGKRRDFLYREAAEHKDDDDFAVEHSSSSPVRRRIIAAVRPFSIAEEEEDALPQAREAQNQQTDGRRQGRSARANSGDEELSPKRPTSLVKKGGTLARSEDLLSSGVGLGLGQVMASSVVGRRGEKSSSEGNKSLAARNSAESGNTIDKPRAPSPVIKADPTAFRRLYERSIAKQFVQKKAKVWRRRRSASSGGGEGGASSSSRRKSPRITHDGDSPNTSALEMHNHFRSSSLGTVASHLQRTARGQPTNSWSITRSISPPLTRSHLAVIADRVAAEHEKSTNNNNKNKKKTRTDGTNDAAEGEYNEKELAAAASALAIERTESQSDLMALRLMARGTRGAEVARAERERTVAAECTFTPRINPLSRVLGSAVEGTDANDFGARLYAYTQTRRNAIEAEAQRAALEEQKIQEELTKCTFAPTIRSNPTPQPSDHVPPFYVEAVSRMRYGALERSRRPPKFGDDGYLRKAAHYVFEEDEKDVKVIDQRRRAAREAAKKMQAANTIANSSRPAEQHQHQCQLLSLLGDGSSAPRSLTESDPEYWEQRPVLRLRGGDGTIHDIRISRSSSVASTAVGGGSRSIWSKGPIPPQKWGEVIHM